MPRSIPAWSSDNHDAAIPPRVKLRVLGRQRPSHGGEPICPDCGRPIIEGETVEFDHAVPLIDGGEHAEGNLRAVHARCHRIKTAREALQRAEARGHQKRAYGIKSAKRPLRSRGFAKAEPQHTATRPIIRRSEQS